MVALVVPFHSSKILGNNRPVGIVRYKVPQYLYSISSAYGVGFGHKRSLSIPWEPTEITLKITNVLPPYPTVLGGRGQVAWYGLRHGKNNTDTLVFSQVDKVKGEMQQIMAEDTANKYDSGFDDEAEKHDNDKAKRAFGPKSTKEAQKARILRLYKRQLEGLPVRQLVIEHAAKEQVGIATAWRDWKGVYELVAEDFERERTKMAGRIFMQRQRLFNAAMKRGQMQTAANVLDSLARQVGCDLPEQTSSLPEIRVSVQPPEELPGSEAAQLPPIDVKEVEDEPSN